jgi:hypothetical protein
MELVPESQLLYARSRRRFAPGEALRFDDLYRLAHLPLLDPDHPDVIPWQEGTDYRMGRYETARLSLVMPVDDAQLEASPVFAATQAALLASGVGRKIAWPVMQRRRARLHATLASGFSAERVPEVLAGVGKVMSGLGPFAVRVGGPMVGDRNLGRIYFPLYPEQRSGVNLLDLLQDAAGARRTCLYLVGYYSLADHLTVGETAELAQILDAHAATTQAVLRITRLWVMQTHDDLALSARVLHEIRGAAPAGGQG